MQALRAENTATTERAARRLVQDECLLDASRKLAESYRAEPTR
jgi:hypothetical protein